jgi:hypothetical protein
VVSSDLGLRVLHVPDAVGGQAAGLARAERSIGLDSVAVALEANPFGYPMDRVIRHCSQSLLAFERDRFRLLRSALRDFDVVHFNFGSTILPTPPRGPSSRRYRAYARIVGMRELAFLRRAEKTIAVTFQGDDVRQGDALRGRYERSVADMHPANYPPGSDAAKRRVVGAFDRYADLIFYLNPDLGWLVPARAEFLPYASVDLADWSVGAEICRARPLVVHAPSDRLTKGTAGVLEAVETLRRSGMDFDFELVEGLTQAEARGVYERADVYIDQLHVGWYGAAAVELMALGKSVVCFLRPDDFQFLPPALVSDLPIVSATAETLADRLAHLLALPDAERSELGRRGRAYVERWHDPVKIAEHLKERYLAAPSARTRSS